MKKYVIVDIDGTIADCTHRLKYINGKKKDWDNFYNYAYNDKPIEDIIHLVVSLRQNYKIVFCTGRRESIRNITKKWLRENLFLDRDIMGKDYLYMRKDGDFRTDSVVKMELLDDAGIKPESIYFVLEDRDSMVKAWRNRGVKCLQVADGNF